MRTFTTEIVVNVRTEEEFSRADLIEYLTRAATIYLDKKRGAGPADHCLTDIQIEWAALKEVSSEKGVAS